MLRDLIKTLFYRAPKRRLVVSAMTSSSRGAAFRMRHEVVFSMKDADRMFGQFVTSGLWDYVSIYDHDIDPPALIREHDPKGTFTRVRKDT